MIYSCGKMFAKDGIFVMFSRNVYLLFINVNKPPLTSVYGIFC